MTQETYKLQKGTNLLQKETYICICRHMCIHIHKSLLLYSHLQIGWHSILTLFLKTFNLVPGAPGFSWDLSLLIGTIRKSHGQNSGSLEKFQKLSRDAVPHYVQSAVSVNAVCQKRAASLSVIHMTKETYILQKETNLLQKETSIWPKENHVSQNESRFTLSCILQKETNMLRKETHVLRKETYIWPEETHVSRNESHFTLCGVLQNEIYDLRKETYTLRKKTYTMQKIVLCVAKRSQFTCFGLLQK